MYIQGWKKINAVIRNKFSQPTELTFLTGIQILVAVKEQLEMIWQTNIFMKWIWIKQLILNNYEDNVKLIIDYWEFIRKIMLCIVYQYVTILEIYFPTKIKWWWILPICWDCYEHFHKDVYDMMVYSLCKNGTKMDLIMKQSIEDVLSIL